MTSEYRKKLPTLDLKVFDKCRILISVRMNIRRHGKTHKKSQGTQNPGSYRYIMRFCCMYTVHQVSGNIKKNKLTNKAKNLIFERMSRERMNMTECMVKFL